MSEIKLYTFLGEDDEIIEEVRAENHDEALEQVSNTKIEFNTSFYSEEV